jgi:hypothetical protein
MWASIYLGADFENGSIHVRRRRNYGYNTEDGPLRLAAQNSALKTLTLVLIGTGSHHDVVVTAHGMAFSHVGVSTHWDVADKNFPRSWHYTI